MQKKNHQKNVINRLGSGVQLSTPKIVNVNGNKILFWVEFSLNIISNRGPPNSKLIFITVF